MRANDLGQAESVMVKEFVFLRRHASISHEQFRIRWSARDCAWAADRPHSPVRYIRNVIEPTSSPVFARDPYDGIGEWWRGEEEEAVRKRARFDDPFVDRRASVSVLAREVPILDRGGGKVKFMSLLRRKAGLSQEEFCRYWATKHAVLVQSVPEVCGYFRRYVQNHCIPGSGRRLDGTGCELDIHGIVEIWFDTVSDLENAMASPRYMETIRPDEATFVALPNIRLLALEEGAVWGAATR